MDQPQEPERPAPPPPPPPQAPPPTGPPPAGPDRISPATAKDPILVLILALFLGGIAYFVIGQWQKGLVSLAVGLCALVIMVVTCFLGSFLFLAIYAMVVIDAYMQADLLRSGRPIGQWTFFGTHL